MTEPELARFILDHEEAFKSRGRLTSLYSDFSSQIYTNPEGYQANLAVWRKALADAAYAGVVPAPGSIRNHLTIYSNNDLARALQHKEHGMPTCLPSIIHDAIRRGDFVPVKVWQTSRVSIYRSSWIPTVSGVVQWATGKLLGPPSSDKLPIGNLVVVKNVEAVAEKVLKQHQVSSASPADRILSRSAFVKRFSKAIGSNATLSSEDLDVLLTHLARDRNEIAFDNETIKFKNETEATPPPITQEDTILARLRDSVERAHAEMVALEGRIESCQAVVREAVEAKQMIRAKTALRSRKLAESALDNRSKVALQLEETYEKLQEGQLQVETVEVMKAAAAALKILHNKVGGSEGVQNVVDSVREQMDTTEEITNIINEAATPVDEGEVDEEFEALERAEREKEEQEEAAKTAARLAEVAEAEEALKEKEAEKADAEAEKGVDATSMSFSQLSVHEDESAEDDQNEKYTEREREGKTLVPALFLDASSSIGCSEQIAYISYRHDSPNPRTLLTRSSRTSPLSQFHDRRSENTHPSTPSSRIQQMQSLAPLRATARTGSTALLRQQSRTTTARHFSTTQTRAGGHGPSYDPPSGWLFGVKPGEKYQKEGWETVWTYGFYGSILFAVVAYAFKPDTSIQTWALEEARRRLEAEGILPDPDSKSKE
ncbi:hypothetical protein DM02DRAFT_601181 [Periconia macrospinosa]|uniref:NADH dehydrogenase [ubiquinone] 1 beta subcomplex subunit 11, mitochondrial n=1 Tax=Periconia macrospinosa TaxID=97972 RepID=A0A2V1DB14_9PLEO|nr:hypothetical protein DM02DRAFT_601181 [Periconia macrospinosa]